MKKTLLFLALLLSSVTISANSSTSVSSSTSIETLIQNDSVTSVVEDSIISVVDTTMPTGVIITLEEMVDPGMADYVERAIKQAESQKPDYIIFEVNTFGGRLDAAFDIVDAITAIDENIKTIAFVNKKAISAGALISLASNEVYMKPTTTIGDCAPVMQGKEGPIIIGEKIQSPLRAKFRNLAEKNGYPMLLSQAMVSIDFEILQLTKGDSIRFIESIEWDEMTESAREGWTKRTIVKKGELLTLTNNEAEKFGFSKGTLKDVDELVATLGIHTLDPIDINWAETLARFIGSISPILMLIGFGALYMEIKTPGFGIFGIIGIVAISIVFLGQYVSGFADHIGLIFIILGTILILVEILLVPGTFISGIAGVACFIIALALSVKVGDINTPEITQDRIDIFLSNINQILLLALVALIFPVVASKYIFPRIPSNYGVMIDETLADSLTHTNDDSGIHLSVNDEGVCKTNLRPAGKALFENRQVEVLAQSGFIEVGSTVKITSIEGQHVFVKKLG